MYMHRRQLGVLTAYVSDEEKTSPMDYIHILSRVYVFYISIFS